jgi:hypothetical protein
MFSLVAILLHHCFHLAHPFFTAYPHTEIFGPHCGPLSKKAEISGCPPILCRKKKQGSVCLADTHERAGE